MIPAIKKSLYVLCRLNNIDIELGDINIKFNIGRADDAKNLAETCKILNELGLFSKTTLLGKYWGYNTEDAEAELQRIIQENKIGGTNV